MDKVWSEPTEIVKRINDRTYLVRNRIILDPIPEDIEAKNLQEEPVMASGGVAARGVERGSGDKVPPASLPVQPSADTHVENKSLIEIPESSIIRSRYGRAIEPVKRYGIYS